MTFSNVQSQMITHNFLLKEKSVVMIAQSELTHASSITYLICLVVLAARKTRLNQAISFSMSMI